MISLFVDFNQLDRASKGLITGFDWRVAVQDPIVWHIWCLYGFICHFFFSWTGAWRFKIGSPVRLYDFWVADTLEDVANTAWSFATVKCRDEKLFAALALAAQQRHSDFHPQEIANTAWAFATVKDRHAKLLAVLAIATERRLSKFDPQNFANTAWAFARTNHLDAKLFAALARAAEQRLSLFNPQVVGNTAWAFATMTYRDEKLFAALALAAERRLSDF